jgi:micrococcal nuclease
MYEYSATLRSDSDVHDGDTFWLDVDLGFGIHLVRLDVRLLGVDCPELRRSDGLGETARDFVVAWFAQHSGPWVIQTVKDHTEKYGRYLAQIMAPDGASLAPDLLAAGLAKPYDGKGPRPIWP